MLLNAISCSLPFSNLIVCAFSNSCRTEWEKQRCEYTIEMIDGQCSLHRRVDLENWRGNNGACLTVRTIYAQIPRV